MVWSTYSRFIQSILISVKRNKSFSFALIDLISFGIQNSQQLLTDRHKVAQLPEDLRNALIVQMASSHRR